jgi:hypothetical protein
MLCFSLFLVRLGGRIVSHYFVPQSLLAKGLLQVNESKFDQEETAVLTTSGTVEPVLSWGPHS